MSIGRRRIGQAAAAGLLMHVPAWAQPGPEPLLWLDFAALERGVHAAGAAIASPYRPAEFVPGITGRAWRTDGYSTVCQAPLALDARSGFALSMWVALESWPSDLEVPVAQLTPSSLVQQATEAAGFDAFIDTFGRWGLRVWTEAGAVTVRGPERLALRRWVHVGLQADVRAGRLVLRRDGAVLAEAAFAPGTPLRLADRPLALATPPKIVKILDFPVNRINGAYDTVQVFGAPLADADWARLSQRPAGATADAAWAVPNSRFQRDPLRPRVHPMPPANWTNEPHGLLRWQGRWHLFYQRTPNGPFKSQMHWGHLSSADLVTWDAEPDALWPELQTETFGFDMKGVWSGHVIAEGDQAFAFYTSVNHGDRLAARNPGIAMATSRDANLRDWTKRGPILDSRAVKDFRDPWLWKDGDDWHMIIGAALETGGGLDHYVLRRDGQAGQWQRRPRFVEPDYRHLDIGSEIWEMPVFVPLGRGVWALVVNPIGGRVSKYGDPATRAVWWTGTWADGLFRPFDRTPRMLDLLPGHLAPTVGFAEDGTARAIGIVDERRTPASQLRAGWANAFSLPRAWWLMPDGRTLGQRPAPELAALRGTALLDEATALGTEPRVLASGVPAYELEIDLGPVPAALTIDVLASPDGRETTRLVFDPAGTVGVDKTRSSIAPEDEGPQRLQAPYDSAAFGRMRSVRVFVDGSVIEAFVNDAAAFAVRSYPSLSGSHQLRISAAGAKTHPNLRLWPLQPTIPPRR